MILIRILSIFSWLTLCTSIDSFFPLFSQERQIEPTCLDDLNDLQIRTTKADIIFTGTLLLMSEKTSKKKNVENIGYVKVWRVIKGSIDDIRNKNSTKLLKEIAAHHEKLDAKRKSLNATAVLDYSKVVNCCNGPLLEVYGLMNDQLCESFINVLDTRVFFLKKVVNYYYQKPKILIRNKEKWKKTHSNQNHAIKRQNKRKKITTMLLVTNPIRITTENLAKVKNYL